MPQLKNVDKEVLKRIESKRFDKRIYREEKKRNFRRIEAESNADKKKSTNDFLEQTFGVNFTYKDVVEKWLSTNLLYLLNCNRCEFNEEILKKETVYLQKKPIISTKTLYVPKIFSIIDEPEISFAFIKEALVTLLFGNYEEVFFSYKNCEKLDVGAQVFLDIVKKESIAFINKCRKYKSVSRKVSAAKQVGLADGADTAKHIQKILLSVGSLAVQANIKSEFRDIIPYRLCIHSRENEYDKIKSIKQKDIDTTTLADYVIDSLARFNKTLTQEKLEDLCTIIGEILINAEEHSTTHHRFSIGYFQDINENGKHIGIFRLVILNFGKTIYETFAENDAVNKEIVERMQQLSKNYTKKRWFSGKQFEEENLWTLYALQEGVTSIPDKKRGNGSIQFIDSFFSIKGEGSITGEKSRMTILSGNTKIIFDGTYRISEKSSDGQNFKVMTFNDSGNIEDAPNKDFVKYVENYFPGTLISARIFLNDDDFE